MTAHGPRAFVKKIRYSDLGATTVATTHTITVPASFFVYAIWYRTGTTFASSSSVTSINCEVGNGTTADSWASATADDVKTAGIMAAASTAQDVTGLSVNGQGFADIDNGADLTVTITPTYSGTLSAGEVDVIVMGFQVPYPA